MKTRKSPEGEVDGEWDGTLRFVRCREDDGGRGGSCEGENGE
ncbi:MAG: hypothetical protein V4697_02505 [Patescibacteria group bacterium]